MCLIFFAIDSHTEFPLIVAANRDEYFQRPTLPLHAWDNSSIIAGKDLTGGGTWMGITPTGRFAALTNFRDPRETVNHPLSRGLLVRGFLESQDSASDYLEAVINDGHRYPGFNLVAGKGTELWYVSNRESRGPQQLGPGIHGLSNHLMNTPWPKVTEGKRRLGNILSAQQESLTDTLFALMNHREPAPDHALPDTGVGMPLEKILSSRFIAAPMLNYGTRCSTLFMLDSQGKRHLFEKTWNRHGEEDEQIKLTI